MATAPADQIIDTYWNGAIEAQESLPPTIPRPQLWRWHDWSDLTWAYRSELHEYVNADTVAVHAVITAPPSVPAEWWTAVRTALEAIATIDTTRVTIQPGFLAWAMPRYLGIPGSEYAALPWTPAHGDFHFANLCAPDLRILDWEGWGLAPAGYDAAMLHSYSLLTPVTADRVQRELAHLLATPAGRYAELAVIAELLDAADQGINRQLAEPLRRRAASILGRPTPTVTARKSG
ncbi:phosphotransferase [Rhizomonospora bruguierae]|uniref:phosphotransferase n=1 Tax=Rhizomonospora bruguierae TaxID=1581705 RepID=UPI001BCE2FBA|nr:phosphotransferase [Micromonospora sp. NBRC 107566]